VDGQRSSGSIISFNKEAFASFGKEQGANAPVSEQSAFAYTTALNYLLRRENNHCLTIGDASTVFWAEADDNATAQAAEGFFAQVFTPPDDEQESAKVFNVLEQIGKGRPLQEIAPELSANIARSVANQSLDPTSIVGSGRCVWRSWLRRFAGRRCLWEIP